MEQEYKGVIEDPRSEEQKSCDFKYDGLIPSATPVEWVEKDTFKNIESIQININDEWKMVDSIEINIGDSWKSVM